MDSGFYISSVKGFMALDSRGNPTVKVAVRTEGGGIGVALAPSGASRGGKEAAELRDGGRRWMGKGVSLALARLEHVVAPRLIGMDTRRQAYIDQALEAIDGSGDFSFIGGNVATATSIAVAKAAADTAGIPLYTYLGSPSTPLIPVPLMNVINGGVHAGNDLDVQEFLLIPAGFDALTEALRAAVEVYHTLKSILKERYGASAVNVGDEGGFAPPMRETREALNTLLDAVKKAGYEPGRDFALGLDVAANQLYLEDRGVYRVEGRELEPGELLALYESLVDEYPLVYLEDPFSESDPSSFAELTKSLGSRVIIVGDDLYCTNPRILSQLKDLKPTNGALLKVNQVGTLSRALNYARIAMLSGMRVIVSHRSGETEDTFIADLAVALGNGLIKTGAPARSERTAKYNRLLEIDSENAGIARYAGWEPFPARPC
ncbi:phosphopyruvate hydratase [Stetteria hydrogenophila]